MTARGSMARGFLPAGLTVILGALSALAAPSAVSAEEFVFERLNRTFEGFVDQLAPIEIGPATVLLASPDHTLTLHQHSAELVADPKGGHRVVLDLIFEGGGTIEADVTLAGVTSHLSDRLRVPAQSLRMVGRAAIRPTAEGYVVEALELPPEVSVRIESEIAGRLVGLCRPMALVLVGLECSALERALSSVSVPMPAAGSEFLLPIEELTDADRERFERYLENRP